jgi:ABC-2 type transport system ATP-binding protein
LTGAAIVAAGLGKRFGAVQAVRGLDLEVMHGEVVGFLGPNGAGKTTTIRMLLGFLSPSAGSCTVLGGTPGRNVSLRRHIGYLPGDLRIDPRMTGMDLFRWCGGLRGGTDERRVDELVDRLDLDPTRPFGTLSKGNRQKIGLIQALQHSPRVLILDEPMTGLDPLVQREFRLMIEEAVRDGAAVLLSSHVLPAVERVASRVAIIRNGSLVSISTVDELLDRTRRTLELRFAEPVAPGRFDGVDGVLAADYEGRTVQLSIDGPVGPALRAATDSGDLLRINNVGDDLEDLFLSLYDRGERATPMGA